MNDSETIRRIDLCIKILKKLYKYDTGADIEIIDKLYTPGYYGVAIREFPAKADDFHAFHFVEYTNRGTYLYTPGNNLIKKLFCDMTINIKNDRHIEILEELNSMNEAELELYIKMS